MGSGRKKSWPGSIQRRGTIVKGHLEDFWRQVKIFEILGTVNESGVEESFSYHVKGEPLVLDVYSCRMRDYSRHGERNCLGNRTGADENEKIT